MLETIQQVENENQNQEHFVTFVSFNSYAIKNHLFNEPSKMFNALTSESFMPNGSTPLYDAMGSCLNRQREAVAGEQNTEVLVTITTYGQENASVEYDFRAIKGLLKELKDLGWTITYLCANHDLEEFSVSIGIEHHHKFEANEPDVTFCFASERKSRKEFYKKAGVAEKGSYFADPDKSQGQTNDQDKMNRAKAQRL